MDDVTIARALHVLAVVIWIGGVAMVTTVLLPAIQRGDLGGHRLEALEAIQRRFAWQARAAILVVGLTGLYMLARLDLWAGFRSAGFWWLHAMVGVWLLFALLLFVVEPLFLHRLFHHWAVRRPEAAFAGLRRLHWLLLLLGLVTIGGAVMGSWG